MPSEPEPGSENRPVPAAPLPESPGAGWSAREPLLRDEGSRPLTRVLVATIALLALALIGYETFLAPKDDRLAWTPPAGLRAADTPQWLQTLCSDRTRELCAAADRARTATDCDAMRAALRSLEALDHRLSMRGGVSARQHWVLVELYGQGHELCQFESAAQPERATK